MFANLTTVLWKACADMPSDEKHIYQIKYRYSTIEKKLSIKHIYDYYRINIIFF